MQVQVLSPAPRFFVLIYNQCIAMRRLSSLAISVLLSILPPTEYAIAECLYTPFEAQVRSAELIFAGTVQSAGPAYAWHMPATRFRFTDIRYLKGQGPPDSLTLVQLGGKGVILIDELSFRIGYRYVVFAVKGYEEVPGSFSAVSCGTGHPFGIWPDSGSTTPVAHVYGGQPLAGFDGEHAVVVKSIPWRVKTAPRAYDAQHQLIPPAAPPRRPLADVLRAPDSSYEFPYRSRPDDTARKPSADGPVEWIYLFPHQDPGTRVPEEEFIHSLVKIIRRQSGSPADTVRVR